MKRRKRYLMRLFKRWIKWKWKRRKHFFMRSKLKKGIERLSEKNMKLNAQNWQLKRKIEELESKNDKI